jgi:hypothetical protein
MAKLEGGCLCGAVRYSADAEPAIVLVCHCRDCQKFSGSAFGLLIGLPQAAVKMHGELKTFTSTGDSGKPIVRRFCPACGSSITDEPSNQPGLMLINGGTLDDPTSMTPTTEIYCEYALTGVHFDGTQRFTKMPIEWYSQRLIG